MHDHGVLLNCAPALQQEVDTSDSPVGLSASPRHPTIADLWAAPPGGAVPSVIHRGGQWTKPEKWAKTLPTNLERRVFPGTQITAYRLAA
jgi:hypothetical protein